MQEHLEALIDGDLSVIRFERYILSFLAGLHSSQVKPLLTQMEHGNINGLSRKEIRLLKTIANTS